MSLVLLVLWLGFGALSVYAAQDQVLAALPKTQDFAKSLEEFENFVTRQMALDKAPGLSIGFLKGGFSWSRGFGYADIENHVPAKPESSYRMASVTKTFTAVAVLQLAEAGKLRLDDEVQTYLPAFPKKKWPFTIRYLLGHLSGMPHYRDYEAEGHIKVSKNTKEALEIFKDFDLLAEPGTQYTYSTYGFNLLGAVVEAASGLPYGEYIKKYIFEALGMHDSRMDSPSDIIPNRVRGYRLIEGEIKNSEYIDVSSRFAGGGTRSTVVDLLKYARGIIEGKLLKEDTWKVMFSSMAIRKGVLTGYGMGWRVNPMNGHFLVSHGGSQPETRTYILIFPKDHIAIACASNRENLNLNPYLIGLAELVLDEDLDTAAYLADREEQVLYDACVQAFSYGLSQYRWKGMEAIPDDQELARAFSYFSDAVSLRALRKDPRNARFSLAAGVHPVSGGAFVKAVSFMAHALEEAYGPDGLQAYHQKGPLAFFNDYIKLSETWPPEKRAYRLPKGLSRYISQWHKDWERTYDRGMRDFAVTTGTDTESLASSLKQTYKGSSLYPDFTSEFSRAALYFMEEDDMEKAFQVLNLSTELYPKSPASWSKLAEAYLWTGDEGKARKLFERAIALDPAHPGVSLNEFLGFAFHLRQARKMKPLFNLLEIAMKFYSKSARLHEEAGDLYLQTGEKGKARNFYEKALKLDPQRSYLKAKIERLDEETDG